jgi:hypothetical protein
MLSYDENGVKIWQKTRPQLTTDPPGQKDKDKDKERMQWQ